MTTVGEYPSYHTLSDASSTNKQHRSSRNSLVLDKGWKKILFGQSLSISLALCSAASSELVNMPEVENMPLFQISGGYFFLSFCLFFLEPLNDVHSDRVEVSCDEESRKLLKNDTVATALNVDMISSAHHIPGTRINLYSPWYLYAALAFLDVQANLFVVLSFRFTSFTSTTLLTSLSVVSAMVASSYLMKRTFKCHHFMGCVLCIIGASMVVLSDAETTGPTSPNNGGDTMLAIGNHNDDQVEVRTGWNLPMLGDVLAIISALVFGFDDTLSEYSIKHSNTNEYLGMLGLFGFIFSTVESILFERDEVLNLFQQMIQSQSIPTHAIQVWIWYMVTLVYFYVAASFFLKSADATLLSISLLTSNMWTTILSITLKGIYPPPAFFYAVVMMGSGVWMYESKWGTGPK